MDTPKVWLLKHVASSRDSRVGANYNEEIYSWRSALCILDCSDIIHLIGGWFELPFFMDLNDQFVFANVPNTTQA
jgi:hypothetical protein